MSNKVAVVTGSGSGLGELIADELSCVHGYDVFRVDRAQHHDVIHPQATIGDPPPRVDLLVNCAGVNRIAWLDDVDDHLWNEVVDTNAKSILKMTQWAHASLAAGGGTVLNIVSNASHMPMRCSAAYNASKGAAAILSKQLARELVNEGITVFSISPNKLKGTGMSDDIDRQVCATRGWTMEEAQKYQVSGLLTGEETDPAALAEFAGFLLSRKERHKMLAGCDIQYGL